MPLPTLNYANASLLPQLADAAKANKEDASAVAEGSEIDKTDLRGLLNKRQTQTGRLGEGKADVDGACHNKKDGKQLEDRGKSKVQALVKACTKECTGVEGCTVKAGAACMKAQTHVSGGCSDCFGQLIHCADDKCLEECQCGSKNQCDSCVKSHCNPQFVHCSGFDPTSSLGAEMSLAPWSTDEGEHSIVI